MMKKMGRLSLSLMVIFCCSSVFGSSPSNYLTLRWDLVHMDLWTNNMNIGTGAFVDLGVGNKFTVSGYYQSSLLFDNNNDYESEVTTIYPYETLPRPTLKSGLIGMYHLCKKDSPLNWSLRFGYHFNRTFNTYKDFVEGKIELSRGTETTVPTSWSSTFEQTVLYPTIGIQKHLHRNFEDHLFGLDVLHSIQEAYWYFEISPFSNVTFDKVIIDNEIWEMSPGSEYGRMGWKAGFYTTFNVGPLNMFSDFSTGARPGMKRIFLDWSFGFILASAGK
jgi:hypothetical protein